MIRQQIYKGELNATRGILSIIYQNARDVFDHNEHIKTTVQQNETVNWADPSITGDIKFPEDFTEGLKKLLEKYPEMAHLVQETRPAPAPETRPAQGTRPAPQGTRPTTQGTRTAQETRQTGPRRTQKRRRSRTPEQETRRQRTEIGRAHV